MQKKSVCSVEPWLTDAELEGGGDKCGINLYARCLHLLVCFCVYIYVCCCVNTFVFANV